MRRVITEDALSRAESEPIRIVAGEELELHLRENPGTGAVWRWSCEPEGAIKEVDIGFQGSPSERATIGGATTRLLTLRAEAPGRTLLRLRRARPWLDEGAVGETVQVTIEIEA